MVVDLSSCLKSVWLHAWVTVPLDCLWERPFKCHGPLLRSTETAHKHHSARCCMSPYCVKLFCSGFRIHPESGEDMKGGRVYSNLHASTSSKTNVQETSPPRQRFSRHSSTERLETVRSGIPGFLEESSKLHSRGRSSGGQRASMNGELCASPCSRHLVHKLPD